MLYYLTCLDCCAFGPVSITQWLTKPNKHSPRGWLMGAAIQSCSNEMMEQWDDGA